MCCADEGFQGPSGNMEPEMLLDILTYFLKRNIVIRYLAIDADCKNPNVIKKFNTEHGTQTKIRLDRAHVLKNCPNNFYSHIHQNKNLDPSQKKKITHVYCRGIFKRVGEIWYRNPSVTKETIKESLTSIAEHYGPQGFNVF